MRKEVVMRFDDDKYINAYNDLGEFPKIHQDIAFVIRLLANQPEPCLDLGACISLLSVQSIACGRSLCVAVETNPNFIAKAVKHPKVVSKQLTVIEKNLPDLESILTEYQPTLVIARRVFPEIEERTPGIVQKLASLFAERGVKKIVLEGRKATKNATNPLADVGREVLQFETYYTLTYDYRNVRLLTRKE